MLQGYGHIQSIGGDGVSTSHPDGGGGSGGRIAVYYASNKTYIGTFDTYGGLGGALNRDGSPGTAFFYHTGGCLKTCTDDHIGLNV